MSLGLFTRYGLTKVSAAPPEPFAPDDIAGLQLWLDASDATTITDTGGAVSAWTSKDANAREFTQPTGSLQPTTAASTQNSLNVIDFAGDSLTSTAAAGTFNFLHDGTSHTIVAVLRAGVVADPNAALGIVGTSAATGSNVGTAIWFDDRASQSRQDRLAHLVTRGGGNVAAVSHISSDNFLPANAYAVLRISANPDAPTLADRSTFVLNAGAPAAGNSSNGTVVATDHTHALQIGATGNGVLPLTGGIAELIAYNVALTTTEIDDVEGYLATKWGITL